MKAQSSKKGLGASEANKARVFKMPFAHIYPMYVKKAETKGRTKEELDEIIL
jgi:hypothetical protein